MVTPEVPTGVAVGQAIFRDKTDGTLLDAAGVQAVGQRQVRDVTGAAAATVEAAMTGESDNEVNGAVSAGVAEIMQGARVHDIATGAVTTARAGTRRPVATALLDARLGQVFDMRDALSDIWDIFPWTSHRLPS